MHESEPTFDGPRLPLAGLLVVAIEQAVAAPFATRQLADLGARVIKLERRGTGDFARHYEHSVGGVSAYFAWLNRGKESVAVDLKSSEDLDLTHELVARADVFVQNLAPGAAARMGLDAPALHAQHERLVACDVSGYGAGGPYGERKAYDLLIQAETGLISITGTEEDPAKAGISVADIAGGMYAFSGVLAALYERERTGCGAALDVSLFDGLAEWMLQPWYTERYRGSPPPRRAARHATIAPYGPFRAADGTVVFGLQNEREWQRFCTDVLRSPRLLEDARFSSNAGRVEHSAALDCAIDAVLLQLSVQEVERRLREAGIAFGRDRLPGELREHPQLVQRARWRRVGAPEGQIEALLPPFSLGERTPRMGSVPALDEHGDAVRGWLRGPTRADG